MYRISKLAHDINDINKNILELGRERESKIKDLMYFIQQKYPELPGILYDNVTITDIRFTEDFEGEKIFDNVYLYEKCNDSLYSPDSGYGTQYIQLYEGRYIAIDYDY